MPSIITTGWRPGSASAPGTCGELIQGVLPDGRRFHVTCPIDLGTDVRLRYRPAPATTVRGLAPGAWKVEQALRRTAELLELGPIEIHATVRTGLQPAKGMASSTADIVAAARALARAAGEPLEGDALGPLAASIESSDGVMFDGVVAVDHHRGTLLRRFAWWPALTVAMFVPLATRDTATTTYPGLGRHAHEYEALLAALGDAERARDAAAFAAQATRSAELNERFVGNPIQRALAPRVAGSGALGLCVGHSGTVCGLLFDGTGGGLERATDAAHRLLPHLPAGTQARVVRMPAPAPTPASPVPAGAR